MSSVYYEAIPRNTWDGKLNPDYNNFQTLFIYNDGSSEILKTTSLSQTQVNENAKDATLILSGTSQADKAPNSSIQRTMIGVKADGTVILLVADGDGTRNGITIPTGEKMLQEMGAVNVLNLDGGASSRMYVEGLGVVTNQQANEPNRYIGSVLQVVPK